MMTIEEKLGFNKYYLDEGNAHIEIDPNYPNMLEKRQLVNACPARCYRFKEDNSLDFDYAGCLECGTCRILSLGKVVTKWKYPADTKGWNSEKANPFFYMYIHE